MDIPDCIICDRKNKSWGSLVKHVAQTHLITSEEYFTRYLGSKTPCIHCGSTLTRFLNISKGYSDNCKGCKSAQHSLVAKQRRAELLKDPVAYESFISKLSYSVKQVWANRTKDEKEIILRNFRNNTPIPKYFNFNSISEEDIWLEKNYKALCKSMKLEGINYSLKIAPQLDVIVNKNLSSLFGFK